MTAPAFSEVMAPAEPRVAVTLADGTKGTMPASAVAGSGATVDEIEEAPRSLGSYGEQAVAGTIGAFSGLTAGLGPAAVVKLHEMYEPGSGAGIAAEMKAGEEAYAATTSASKMGGMALGGLGVGKALRFIPGVGIAAAGEGLGSAVTGAIGDTVAGRLAGHAVNAAGQQAAYNIAEQISEDSLGDHDTTAEKLVSAGANWNVLLAGGLGAAAGGMCELWKAARPARAGLLENLERTRGPVPDAIGDQVSGVPGAGKAAQQEAAEASRFLDDAARAGMPHAEASQAWSDMGRVVQDGGSMGGNAARRLADMHANWASKGDAAAAEVIQRGAANRALRVAEQEGIIDTHARALRADTNDVLRNVHDLSDEAQIVLKREQVHRLIPTDNLEAQVDEGLRLRQRVQEVADEWNATTFKGGGEGALNKLNKKLKDFDRVNANMVIPESEAARRVFATDHYLRLEDLKRATSGIAMFGRPKIGLPEIAHSGDALYHELKGALESESVFGRMGAAQTANNASITQDITVNQLVAQRFGTVLEQKLGRPIKSIDSGPMDSFLRSIGGSKSDTNREIFANFISAKRGRIAAIREHYELTPVQAATLSQGEASLVKMEKTLASAMKEADIVSKIRLQMAEEEGRSIGGGILGAAIDVVRSPIKTQAILQDVARAADRVTKSGKAAVQTIADWKGTSSPYRGKAPSPKESAAEIAGVKKAAESPEVMAARATDVVGSDLHRAAPKTAMAAGAVVARAVTYLATQAPQGYQPTGITAGKEPRKFSEMELTKWNRTASAVKDPIQTVANAKHGHMTRDGVQALKFVYPRMYEELRGHVLQQLADMERSGKLSKMPYEQKAMMGALLDIQPDDTFAPKFIAMLQASKAGSAQPAENPSTTSPQKGGGRRPIKLDSQSYDPNPTRT